MSTIETAAKAKSAPKRDRLHLRLDLASRNKIELAAYYLNKTASEFVLAQALAGADKSSGVPGDVGVAWRRI